MVTQIRPDCQMTEPKTTERLKGSNFGTHLPDLIS